jgi:peptidoglycan/xylan/chitin deacetylase (PgdA/CDA1 family)
MQNVFGWLKEGPISTVCSWVPLDIWHRLAEVDLLLPYYHLVSDAEIPHVSGLYKFRSVGQFKADLEFFLRSYVPITLQDLINHLNDGHTLPARCFLLTFDDGFREVYDIVAPILRSVGVPATFFLITSAIDNHQLCDPQKKSLLIRAVASVQKMSTQQEVCQRLATAGISGADAPSQIRNISRSQRHLLEELAALLGCDFAAYSAEAKPFLTSEQVRDLQRQGFGIGAHTVDHPRYPELTLSEQLFQTLESLTWLSDRYQFKCESFAFPYSDAGVSPEFFRRAFADSRLQLSFGTGGMFRHAFPRNLERFTMEKTELPTNRILTKQFSRTFLRRPFRQHLRSV